MSVMKCTAAGDAMIFRQLPGHYEGFEALRDFIAQGELRFLNLETTIHNFETYGAALSGGSWFCAEPRVLDGVKEFGFNMLTTANNHAMDYSHTGLLKTLEYLQAAGLPTCGTGPFAGRSRCAHLSGRARRALRRDRRVLDVLSRRDGGRADAHYAGASGPERPPVRHPV